MACYEIKSHVNQCPSQERKERGREERARGNDEVETERKLEQQTLLERQENVR